MIIDCHVHLDRYGEGPIEPKERLAALKKGMQEANVAQAIILQDIEAPQKTLSADDIISLIKDESQFSVVGTIKLTGPAKQDAALLEGLLRKKKIVGIKLYTGYEPVSPNDQRCGPIYELCEQYKVPVIFHLGDTYLSHAPIKYAHPLAVDEVANSRPHLKIVMAHMGNPWITDTMVILSRNKNVYADISGLILGPFQQPLVPFLRDDIKKLIAWCGGTQKLLFGTDWPINAKDAGGNLMKGYISLVNSLGLTNEDKDLVFFKNAQKVFNLPIRMIDKRG